MNSPFHQRPSALIIVDFVPGLTKQIIDKVDKRLNIDSVIALSEDNEIATDRCELVLMKLGESHYGDYDPEKIFACSQSLSDSMAVHEAISLRCLDKLAKITNLRINRSNTTLDDQDDVLEPSYSLRKRVYLRHLGYWSQILKKYEVKAVVSTNIPHFAADYVIYGLSETANIPFLTFEEISHFGRLLPRNSIRTLSYEQKDALNNSASFGTAARITRERAEFYSRRCSEPHPYYMSAPAFGGLSFHLYGKSNWYLMLASIAATIRGRSYEPLLRRKLISLYNARSAILERARRRYEKEAPRDRSYVYVPLHVQPELSTAPLGGVFADQINVLRMLSQALPDDVYIYVKEHPAQGALTRSPDSYREMVEVPRVVLVKRETSTFELIRQAIAVATCTGTAGVESLFQGVPCLFFGECVFAYAPGAHRITNSEELARAIKDIINKRRAPGKLDSFVNALETLTIPGSLAVIDEYQRKTYGFNRDEINESVSDYIVKWIQSVT